MSEGEEANPHGNEDVTGQGDGVDNDSNSQCDLKLEESVACCHPAPSDTFNATTLNQQSKRDAEPAQSTFCDEYTAITTESDNQDQSGEYSAVAAGSTTSTINTNDRAHPTEQWVSLPPGAYRVRGPGHEAAMREEHGMNRNGNNDNASCDEEAIFEGFIPEPSRQDIRRLEAQEMLASAITLDESAIRIIPMSRDDGGVNEGRDVNARTTPNDDVLAEDEGVAVKMEEEGHRLVRRVKSPITIICLTSLLLSVIALGVAFGSNNDESVSSNEEPCVIENLQERYDRARSIVSDITSAETLANATSPQNKALEWLVCHDRISSKLIDRAGLSGPFGGDIGESQILRRYALATFFFATSERGPWIERWNFLSGEKHECAWHLNKTRSNFPYGDFDPAGIVCLLPSSRAITLDDDEGVIWVMHLNFRIPNNLTGTIPPEVGHIQCMTDFILEHQMGLHGSIPSTIGNMGNLTSFSVLFAGPEFGGVIPSSLFTNPTIKWIAFHFNEGTWSFPPSLESKANSGLLGLAFQSSGFSGTLPSFFSEFTSVKELNLEGNSFGGTVPDSFGTLASLEFFSLLNNDLTGTLPRSLGQLSEATAMVFGKNNFIGTLPTWAGNLTKLRLLDLSYNEFTGGIPTSFSRLQSLEHISLQHNADLHGPISAFGSLNSLSSLLLYGNNFSSTIPEGLFSNFTGQIVADFGHNNFTGMLPDTFTRRASNISYLSIMANDFDESTVDDVICKQVPTLFADCDTCPCCKNCCEEEDTNGNNGYCHFDLDFYILSGLECGAWWSGCGVYPYDLIPTD